MLVKAAINGNRTTAAHPLIPITPAQQANEAKAAVQAGAEAIHVHVTNPDGRESLDPNDINKCLEAIRTVCPGIPIGISTGDWIVPDLQQRLSLIRSWGQIPDFASVNMIESGAIDVAKLLLEKGVGIEAGICSIQAAEIFAGSGIAQDCLRVLIELAEEPMPAALANLEMIETVLNQIEHELPRLLHGENATAWEFVKIAAARDYDTRIGFEDVLTLPDGAIADGNAALISAAIQIIDREKINPTPVKAQISFNDFEKLDIRVGTITTVSAIPKSKKLMKLTVDFGDHSRSILAGIKQERANPKEIEGKQALFILNLPEKKMAGETSQGMLFDIGYADGITPCLAMPERPVPNGSRAG